MRGFQLIRKRDNVFSTQINGFSTQLDTGQKIDVFSTQLNNDLKLFMIWVVKKWFIELT